MKKFILSVATVALLFAAVPSQATAKNPAPATVNSPEVIVLLSRLDEIKGMKLSELSRSEKNELRGEVRVIKSELKRLDSTVTISVGLLLIIIILILLL
jgi:hypothetical protein